MAIYRFSSYFSYSWCIWTPRRPKSSNCKENKWSWNAVDTLWLISFNVRTSQSEMTSLSEYKLYYILLYILLYLHDLRICWYCVPWLYWLIIYDSLHDSSNDSPYESSGHQILVPYVRFEMLQSDWPQEYIILIRWSFWSISKRPLWGPPWYNYPDPWIGEIKMKIFFRTSFIKDLGYFI